MTRASVVSIGMLWSCALLAQTPPTGTYGFNFSPNNAMALSSAGTASLRYNSGTGQFEQSIAGGAYAALSAVSSVSNVDGTLTVAPTTGPVVASIALGHPNTWIGVQAFPSTSSLGAIFEKDTGVRSAFQLTGTATTLDLFNNNSGGATVPTITLSMGSYNSTGLLATNTYTENFNVQAQDIILTTGGNDGVCGGGCGFDINFNNTSVPPHFTNGDGVTYKAIGVGTNLFTNANGNARAFAEIGQGGSTSVDFLINALVRTQILFGADKDYSVGVSQSLTGAGHVMTLVGGQAATGSGAAGGNAHIEAGAGDGAGANGAVVICDGVCSSIAIGRTASSTNITGSATFDSAAAGKTFSFGGATTGWSSTNNVLAGNAANFAGQLILKGGTGTQDAQLLLDNNVGAQLRFTTNDKIIIDGIGIHVTGSDATDTFDINGKLQVSNAGLINKYNNETTHGTGVAYVETVGQDIGSSGAGAQNTTITTFTPAASGLYIVWQDCSTVTNGDTVTTAVTYTDADSNVAQTRNPLNASVLAANTSASGVAYIRANTATAIVSKITISAQNTTVCSSTIERTN